ncbi:MAG: polysaccharide deacetylase family protein [Candidatus Rokubacteria bacterium]|nr:polysaccharide deacetylase family protein [Candidatus Rokubacteria bacterium]
MALPYRSVLKRGFYGVLSLLREDIRRASAHGRRRLLTVLCLHRVAPDPNPFWSPLHPRVFDELLRFLRRRYRVCTLDEAADDPDCASDRRPWVAISFDDGYRDFVEYAMPLLHRHRVPVIQNVIAESMETGRPPWTVLLTDFLAAAPVALLRELRIPGFDRPLRGSDPDHKASWGAALDRFLKLRPRAERAALWGPVQSLMECHGPFRTTVMMTPADVREAVRLHEIGAHSHSHESMAYESDEFFLDDLERCRRWFAANGLPWRTYAFPNGSYRPVHLELLRQRGITRILLADDHLSARTGPVYSRVSITASSVNEARLQAAGFRATRP